MRTTYTYALLEVSPQAYDEIAQLLRDAGYAHVFGGEAIDMHGLALVKEVSSTPVRQWTEVECTAMNKVDPRVGECDRQCEWTAPYGWVPEAGCPVHDA